MTFTLTIKMDGAAFEEAFGQLELGACLRSLANGVEDNPDKLAGFVRDTNGNTVGEWEIK